MKRTLLFAISLFICASSMFAQAPIVVQNGDEIFVHSRLDTIVKHSQAGSTIYLPGGNILLSSELLIDKELHIIGAGHYPDSSAATSVTMISGANIRFTQKGSRSSMSGIFMHTDILFGRSIDDTISFIDISRCNLASVYLGYANIRNTPNTNFRLSENVVRGRIEGADAQYCLFEKNIFNTAIRYLNGNTTFVNNIFCYYYPYDDVFHACSGLSVNNNIFTRDNTGLTGSQINNNLFAIDHPASPTGTNYGFGNRGKQAVGAIFENFDGMAFNYDADLHLKEDCLGIGAGTDGKDIGLYGTEEPYKPSAVPHNPHIQMVKIGNKTVNGLLPVEIKVAAQHN